VAEMLLWWGDYVDGIVNESKVIVGNFDGGVS
jgi:hypothetical protein